MYVVFSSAIFVAIKPYHFMRTIFSVFVLISVISSCKPFYDPFQPPAAPIARYVSKIANADNEYREYKYNAEHRLTKYTSQFVNGLGVTRLVTDFVYTNNVITKAESQSGRVEYITKSGKVIVTKFYSLNGSLRSTIYYTYNNKGQLIEWVEKINNPQANEPAETKQIYQYHSDGNLKRIENFYRISLTDPFTSMGGTLYDRYDNYRNPDLLFGTPLYLPGVVVAINNPGRIQSFTHTGTIHQINLLEYTYYTDGMIATKKSSISNSSISILFTYTY